MSEPLEVYERTIRLAVGDPARSSRKALDAEVAAAVEVVPQFATGYEVSVDRDESGHLKARITRGGLNILISGRYGHNTSFVGTEKSQFVSYTIEAEASCASVDRAAALGGHLSILAKICGVSLAIGLIWLTLSLNSHLLHHVLHLLPVYAGVMWFGIWCGGKIGDKLETWLENQALKNAGPAMEDFEAVWDHLTARFNGIALPMAA